MRAFIACLALSAVTVHAGHLSAGSASAYVPASGGYSSAPVHSGYAAPVVSSGGSFVSSGPQYVSSGPSFVSSGPSFVSSGPALAAGPAFVSSAAPAFIPAPAAPATVGAPQVVASGVAAPRVHEVHSHTAGRHVRVEEYRGPRQVVRVLEGGQAPPEVFRVQGPAQQGSIVRLVTRGGQNYLQHVVHQNPQVQVVNVQKQPAPGPRVLHVVRSPPPATRVEVSHSAPAPSPQVVLQAAPESETHVVGPSATINGGFRYAAAPAVTGFATGASYGAFAAPAVTGFATGASYGAFAAPAAYAAPVAYAAPAAYAAPVAYAGHAAYAAPVGYATSGAIQPVATKVVNYDAGYSQGGHVKVIKKHH